MTTTQERWIVLWMDQNNIFDAIADCETLEQAKWAMKMDAGKYKHADLYRIVKVEYTIEEVMGGWEMDEDEFWSMKSPASAIPLH